MSSVWARDESENIGGGSLSGFALIPEPVEFT